MYDDEDEYNLACGCCRCCGCDCPDRIIVCQEEGCYDEGPLDKGQCDSGHPF